LRVAAAKAAVEVEDSVVGARAAPATRKVGAAAA
jgi:hypothetical protein